MRTVGCEVVSNAVQLQRRGIFIRDILARNCGRLGVWDDGYLTFNWTRMSIYLGDR